MGPSQLHGRPGFQMAAAARPRPPGPGPGDMDSGTVTVTVTDPTQSYRPAGGGSDRALSLLSPPAAESGPGPLRPLSVLSHFNRACIGLFKQLYRLCERRFVRTFDLQKEFSLSEAVDDGGERDGLGSEDLKSVGAPLPLGQKHVFWNKTGNLSLIKRNALTTEPRMQI